MLLIEFLDELIKGEINSAYIYNEIAKKSEGEIKDIAKKFAYEEKQHSKNI